MEYKFRKAKIADMYDLDKVLRVICDDGICFEKAADIIEKINLDQSKYLMVAEEIKTGRICGTLMGVVFEDICGTGQPILLIENVAVLKERQGRGIGKLMFEEIEKWASSFNIHYEMLVTDSIRVDAHHFYRRMKMSEEKAFKKYF